MLSLSLNQTTPISIQKVDEKQMEKYLVAINETLEILTSKKLKEILEIQSSEHFFRRTVLSIENELQKSIQLENTHVYFKQKREDLMNSLQTIQPKIKSFEEQSTKYVSLSEKALSQKMNGRRVIIHLTS
jgi:multidrug resistance efflux pump